MCKTLPSQPPTVLFHSGKTQDSSSTRYIFPSFYVTPCSNSYNSRVSVWALQTDAVGERSAVRRCVCSRKKGPVWKAVEGRQLGEGFVKYGILSPVLHHLRQAVLQLHSLHKMRITWVVTLKSRETRITRTGWKNMQLVLKVSKDLRPAQHAGEAAA